LSKRGTEGELRKQGLDPDKSGLPLDEEETKKGFLKLVNLGKTRLHPHLLLIRCFPER
jgi:hypothetical protein